MALRSQESSRQRQQRATLHYIALCEIPTLHCIALCEILGDLRTRALITLALCTCGRARENRLRMQVLLALRRLSRPGLAGHDPAGGTM